MTADADATAADAHRQWGGSGAGRRDVGAG